MSDDWGPICSADTPWAEVEKIIERHANRQIDSIRQQLEANPELTDVERARGMLLVVPFIRRQTHEVIEAGWLSLQKTQ